MRCFLHYIKENTFRLNQKHHLKPDFNIQLFFHNLLKVLAKGLQDGSLGKGAWWLGSDPQNLHKGERQEQEEVCLMKLFSTPHTCAVTYMLTHTMQTYTHTCTHKCAHTCAHIHTNNKNLAYLMDSLIVIIIAISCGELKASHILDKSCTPELRPNP